MFRSSKGEINNIHMYWLEDHTFTDYWDKYLLKVYNVQSTVLGTKDLKVK